MAFLIRTIDTTADGREIVRDRKVPTRTVTIGRGADNDIHLPDLAVENYHARLDQLGDSKMRVEAAGTLGFHVDGRVTKLAKFDAHEGVELGFGSFRLLVSQESDGPITVTISQALPDAASADALAGFSLASALPGKRVMAWLALGIILFAFLAVPIYSNLTRTKVEPSIAEAGQVAMDASWSTGALSQAHHGLEDNCEACHAEPFVAVRDETCLTCHKDIGDHADKPRLAKGRGPMSKGDALQWAVAETFGKEGPGSCTTCHTEHEGAGAMEPTPQQFCSDCHGTLGARLTDTELANAADFGTAHPQFKALLTTTPGQSDPTRVSLGDKPKEFNGLRFPHDMHLAGNGGVARMAINLGSAKGYGAPLVCSDCHTPTADGAAFLPVSMEEDCEACHSLVYDKVGPTFRTLRHGDVAQMQADLAAMDRSPRRAAASGLSGAEGGRRRPGAFAQGGLYYQNFGRPVQSLVAINRALSRDGVCGECHIPTTTNGKPDVMPVKLQDHYLAHSWFDHADHKQEQCTSCHKADTSETSADVLLPGISTCRTCHMGEKAQSADVPSSCAMCHSYHPRGGSGAPANMPGRKKNPPVDSIAFLERRTP